MRTFFDYDSKLRSTGEYFKRFSSLSALPFDAIHNRSRVTQEMIAHYESMIRKQLISKFAVPSLVRADFGQLVNVDEALEGIPECYRHTRPIKSVLKLGLNVSGDYYVTEEIFAMRAAAILAVFNLAKSRGQKVQFDICYGYYYDSEIQTEFPRSHFRIGLQTPTTALIKSVMTVAFRDDMIAKCVRPVSNTAVYRLWKIAEHRPELGQEFDFVLDRMETADEDIEYKRILAQIERLK